VADVPMGGVAGEDEEVAAPAAAVAPALQVIVLVSPACIFHCCRGSPLKQPCPNASSWESRA
jgi:hypothetical protein